MTQNTIYISILLFLFHQTNAQTGLGCTITNGCPPGQVRINAIRDARGGYLGGCNCGCNPLLGNPSSIMFCDPSTHQVDVIGDCSCNPSATNPTNPPNPPNPQQQTPGTTGGQPLPPPGPLPIYTNPPQTVTNIPNPNLVFPPRQTNSPLFPMPPQTTNVYIPPAPPAPARPMEVICDSQGPKPCGCPIGHIGECYIVCEGQSADACKDSLLECNNDGYPCFINCMMENSCSGATSIMGPANGALTVNCIGDKSCDGSVKFNGEAGTDLIVSCEGITSCKGSQFNFGKGVSKVSCLGDPDSCLTSVFNLLPNARNMPGAAFECIGSECPQNAPQPFSNVIPPKGECRDAGNCACKPGANEPCKLTCDGTIDACKDAIIECNSDGYDCVIDCIAMNSCSGSTTIIGPIGASLTVNCMGEKACEGSVTFEASDGTDFTANCLGNEACKGSGVIFNMGNDVNTVKCSGIPDSCKDAQFNIPTNANVFLCTGGNCPQLSNFNNAHVQPTSPTQPTQPIQPIQPTQSVGPAVPAVPQPSNPFNVQPIQPIQPIQPVQHIQPVPINNPIQPTRNTGSPYCCLTSIPGFKPWRGRCWDETTADGCMAEPSNRCVWEPLNCLPNPPVNNKLPDIPCKATANMCTKDNQCCSDYCQPDGTCR